MGKNPVKQHTVPVSYLQGFSIDPRQGRESQIYVYDFKRKKEYSSIVGNVSIKSDFYTVEDNDGEKNYEIEKFFGSRVEGISQIIKKMDDREQISEKDANYLSSFIGFQEFRSKYRLDLHNQAQTNISQMMMRQAFANPDRAKKVIKAIEENKGHSFSISAEEAVKQFGENAENYQIEDKHGFLKNMFELHELIWGRIYHSKRIVYFDTNGGFITSDHPMHLVPPSDMPSYMGVGLYTGSIGFPLSKFCYLNLHIDDINTHPDSNFNRIFYHEVDDNIVKLCNCYSAWNITEWIFGKDKRVLQDIIDLDQGKISQKEIEQRLIDTENNIKRK